MSELETYTPPNNSELEQTWQLASKLAATEFVPKPMRGSPESVLACMLTGRELGIGPMQALRDIYLVNGRPSLSATLMVARVRTLGHRFRTLENTDHQATVQIHRKAEAQPEPPVTFTIEDAKRAKLISKDIWQSYPARMCWARAASAACRRDCPEALGGAVYTPEELEDPTTETSWGEVEVEESPGPAQVTSSPAGPGATTQIAPTHDQVKRLRGKAEAGFLLQDASEEFQRTFRNIVVGVCDPKTAESIWKGFWRDATLASLRDHLHDAIDEMSDGAAPTPPGGRPSDSTSEEGQADRGPGEGSPQSAMTPGSDSPNLTTESGQL